MSFVDKQMDVREREDNFCLQGFNNFVVGSVRAGE